MKKIFKNNNKSLFLDNIVNLTMFDPCKYSTSQNIEATLQPQVQRPVLSLILEFNVVSECSKIT